MKQKLALLISVLAFFAFTGIATAATVDVTVGVPYIQLNECDQVGNMAFEWDHETTFTVGDQIQIGLVGQPTFCKAVNMLVAVVDTDGSASGFTAYYTIPTGDTQPVRQVGGTDGSLINGTVLAPAGETAGVAFMVQAASGSDTLLITVVADTDGDGTFGLETHAGPVLPQVSFVDGGDPFNTEFQLQLFNDKTYALTVGNAAIYPYNPSTGEYTAEPIDQFDNALCVDTGPNYGSQYVGVGISAEDNLGQKLWDFNPASPNIAIIKSGQSASLYDCRKSEVGLIALCTQDTSGDQEESNATNEAPIQNENGTGEPGYTGVGNTHVGPESDNDAYSDATADAYIDETHRNNNMVFQTTNGQPFENASYAVELEIRVAPAGSSSSDDALAGDYGFYWNAVSVGFDGFASAASVDYADNATSACAVADNDVDNTYIAGTPYNASGTEITDPIADTDGSDCAYDGERALKLVVDADVISAFGVNTLTDNYLLVDIPDIAYDPARVTAGMQLYVFAKLIRKPCDLEGEGALHVATVYTESGSGSTGSPSAFTFPYFAEVGANGFTSNFWNGFTLANTSTSATETGTATLTIYEADGDVFSASVEVEPGSVSAFLLMTLNPTLVTQGVAGDGVFGGQRCWIYVSADFQAFGSCMITNKAAGGVTSYVVGNNTADQ